MIRRLLADADLLCLALTVHSMQGRKERRGAATRPKHAGKPQTLLSSEAAFLLRQAQLAEQTEQPELRPLHSPPPKEEAPGELRMRADNELEVAERRIRQLTQEMGGSPRLSIRYHRSPNSIQLPCARTTPPSWRGSLRVTRTSCDRYSGGTPRS